MADIADTTPPGLDEFLASNPQPQDRAPAANMQAPIDDAPPGLDEFIKPEMDEAKYGSGSQQALAGLEGVGKGLAGPLATGAERLAGVPEEDIRGRAEANPFTHGAGEVAGLVGGALTGTGLGGALGKVGEAVGLGSEALGLGKLGTSVAKSAIENLVYQGQDEASKLILRDPGQSADTAIADMGLAALIGGGFGTIAPLWHATMGKQTGGILGAIANKAGGIEGIVPEATQDLIAKSGMDIAPELKGLISDNPSVQEVARTLMQTDSNASGKEIQQSYKNFTKQAGDKMVEALGRSPEEVATSGPVSKYESGKAIGNIFADEYESQLSPFTKIFDELKGKFKNVDLPEASESLIGQKVPGAIDGAVDKISQLAVKEGWATSPSSDIMREVNRAIKELPLQKNLKNLGDYITQVGASTNKDPMNGPLRRAGAMISDVLRGVESDTIAAKLGEKEGPQAVEAFKAAREGYAVQSSMKEAIDSRLGVRGSTSGFANAVREMARTDGEGVLRRLSGKGDADLLNFLQSHYPQTAEAVKNYHINDLLQTAVSKAKEGNTIDNATLLNSVKKLSPEMRNFLAPHEAQNTITAMDALLSHFKNPSHNFSNTARVLDKLTQDLPGSAVGTALAMTGHGFIKSALAIPLIKAIGKDAPDAIRLATLKFLGSSQQIDAAGFKAMVDYIQHTMKGETLLSNATKNLFKAGSQVLPESQYPTDKERNKIKKAIESMKDKPNEMLGVAGKTGHYMPEHATNLTQTAANAVNVLNSRRPNIDPQSPLDTHRSPTSMENAQYNRMLDIAQQPLMVLKHISEGKLTPDDVMLQRSIYPQLYARTVEKLTDHIANAQAKGQLIPYKTRMGLSLYMGQSLDSTMNPNSIVAAQPKPAMNQPQAPTQPASNPKHSTTSLSKMPKMYSTPGQAAEQDRQKRE